MGSFSAPASRFSGRSVYKESLAPSTSLFDSLRPNCLRDAQDLRMDNLSGWAGYLDQEKRTAGSTASKFNNLLFLLINFWGMRGFRSLLASLHCAQRNNHIRFRKASDWKGRETGTVPTDVLPRESGNTLCCGKWGAEVSQSARQVCASLRTGSTRIVVCSAIPNAAPSQATSTPCMLHHLVLWCGNEGREIKAESGWWQRSREPWANHLVRQALVLEELRWDKGTGNKLPMEAGGPQILWMGGNTGCFWSCPLVQVLQKLGRFQHLVPENVKRLSHQSFLDKHMKFFSRGWEILLAPLLLAGLVQLIITRSIIKCVSHHSLEPLYIVQIGCKQHIPWLAWYLTTPDSH